MNEKQTKLHFMRIREEGEKAFYDNQTDIRALLPEVTEITLDVLDQITDDKKLKKEYDYLTRCFRIFQIKIKEDPTDVVKLVNDFYAAICKVSPKAFTQWAGTTYILLLTAYALFDRRDAKTDKDAMRKLMSTAKLSALCICLPPELLEQVNNVYKKNREVLDEQFAPTADGRIVCEETGDIVITDIKKMATMLIGYEGPNDWESVARACDSYFMSEKGKQLTDHQQMLVALAYPTYDKPYIEVEEDTDAESAR